MKGLRASIKKSELKHDNNSRNYNYDYADYNSDVNDEVFNTSKEFNKNIQIIRANSNSAEKIPQPEINSFYNDKYNESKYHSSNNLNKNFNQTSNISNIQSQTNYQSQSNYNNTNKLNSNFNSNSNYYPNLGGYSKHNVYSVDSGSIDTLDRAERSIDNNKNNSKDPLWVKRFDEENLFAQKEAKNLIEQTKKLIEGMSKKTTKVDNINKENKTWQSPGTKSVLNTGTNMTGFSKKNKSKSKKYFEDPVKVKSRSQSPPTFEPRGIETKFNNSMINSETNIKSNFFM